METVLCHNVVKVNILGNVLSHHEAARTARTPFFPFRSRLLALPDISHTSKVCTNSGVSATQLGSLAFRRISNSTFLSQLGGRAPSIRASQLQDSSSYETLLQEGKDLRAFVEHTDCVVEGAPEGPLKGLIFSAKDMYHVAGYATGFGNPTWLSTHPVSASTAPAVQALLDAGATLVGKTAMDELAFSLAGENAHYGTPVNPAAPERIPGGSSSGSASVVAARLVDFALGSDTAGSVRVPASFCGILGFRPSHGVISMEGALPLQPTLDTPGWFARDAATLLAVGRALLPPPPPHSNSSSLHSAHSAHSEDPLEEDSFEHSAHLANPSAHSAPSEAQGPSAPAPAPAPSPSSASGERFRKWVVAEDAFDLAEEATTRAIYEAMAPHIQRLTELLGQPEKITVGGLKGAGDVGDWMRSMRVLQMREAWECHGEWLSRERPHLGPGVKDRFEAAARVAQPDVETSLAVRLRITEHMRSILGEGVVLMLPTTPGIAPRLRTPPEELELSRQRTLSLTCIAGPAGLPQVSLPIASVEGCPVGLSLVGPAGWDLPLLELAVEIMALFGR